MNQVRKEKLGDRITTLHQLVSPFGKVNTGNFIFVEVFCFVLFPFSMIKSNEKNFFFLPKNSDQSGSFTSLFVFISLGFSLLTLKRTRERWLIKGLLWCVHVCFSFADWHCFSLVRSHWVYQIPSGSNWGDVSIKCYILYSTLLATQNQWAHALKVSIIHAFRYII